MRQRVFLILLSGLIAIGFFVFQYLFFVDGKLHIIFCDVGQGDSILIRTPKGSDILVDAGGNDKVLDCLSDNRPFWDSTIEVALLTHPHLDHFGGFFSILKHYQINEFGQEDVINDTAEFRQLQMEIKDKLITTKKMLAKDSYKTNDGVNVTVLSPSKEFIKQTSPTGLIGEKSEFASLILHIRYKQFDLVLTGDSQSNQLDQATQGLSNIEILQVPHHGSKTGLNEEVLKRLSPEVAVISVGKNRYGHPTSQVLSLLSRHNINILRTDLNGPLNIAVDNKDYSIHVKE